MRAMMFSITAFALGVGAAGAAPHAPAGLGDAFPQVCAPGYHTDRGGNCQPDAAQTNPYCPPGLVYHPAFDGWTCNPPPPEAY